jgi:hypothetical protein
MELLTYLGAALLAVLALALPALAHKQHWAVIREDWRRPLRLMLLVLHEDLGVVVVTYCHPILGAPTTTAPTAAQAAQMNELAAQVFFADGDTQAVITHSMGLPNSFPTWLWPQVFFNKSLGGGSDSSFATNFTFGLTNTNSVTMNKIGIGTGQGGTYNVYIRKPWSASQ